MVLPREGHRSHDRDTRHTRAARSQAREGRRAGGTVTWYAFKISDTSYGIFDTFAADDARTAHINGQIPAALASVSADLLASEPDIRLVDVLAVK
jgi:hypothetical protein